MNCSLCKKYTNVSIEKLFKGYNHLVKVIKAMYFINYNFSNNVFYM